MGYDGLKGGGRMYETSDKIAGLDQKAHNIPARHPNLRQNVWSRRVNQSTVSYHLYNRIWKPHPPFCAKMLWISRNKHRKWWGHHFRIQLKSEYPSVPPQSLSGKECPWSCPEWLCRPASSGWTWRNVHGKNEGNVFRCIFQRCQTILAKL